MTNSSGGFTLSIQVEYATFLGLVSMSASVTDSRYVTISASGNYSTSGTTIYPSFTVILDTDRDGIDDNVEWQIAEKFKPVLHKHSYDKQQGLANFEKLLVDGKFTLEVYNDLGEKLFSQRVSGSPSALHKWDIWHWDTYGYGSISHGRCRLNLDDDCWYKGASIGDRPLYFHVYKSEPYYYVQYWYYFTMDNKTEFLNGSDRTWHESDWEHVTIKLTLSNNIFYPLKVNFYFHDGGQTWNANECWWSPTSANTYTNLQQGYDEGHTHLHVWLSANGHGSYNRYAKVYRIKSYPSGKYYQDRVDYSGSGYDLYFPYDFLVKMGEIDEAIFTKCPESGFTLEYHRYPSGPGSKHWLAFVGRCGVHENPWIWSAGYAPTMPSNECISHGWRDFTIGNPYFGNDSFPQNILLEFVTDNYTGD